MDPLNILNPHTEESLDAAVSLNGVNQRRNFEAEERLVRAKEAENKIRIKDEAMRDYVKMLSQAIKKVGKEIEALDETGRLKEMGERLDLLNAENLVANRETQRRVAVLKEWMRSQIGMKRLFKKYGKLPDGMSEAEAYEEAKSSDTVRRGMRIIKGQDFHMGEEVYVAEDLIPSTAMDPKVQSSQQSIIQRELQDSGLYPKVDSIEKDAIKKVNKAVALAREKDFAREMEMVRAEIKSESSKL